MKLTCSQNDNTFKEKFVYFHIIIITLIINSIIIKNVPIILITLHIRQLLK